MSLTMLNQGAAGKPQSGSLQIRQISDDKLIFKVTGTPGPEVCSRASASLEEHLAGQGFSDKLIKGLRLQNCVTVNGCFHRMIDAVAIGDEIAIHWPQAPPDKHLLPAADLGVPILHEDNSFIAFDKPPGLPIHPSARHYRRSLGNYFAALYPGQSFRPIGRLDKDTTGICLVAKNPFCAAIANQNIQKVYYAILEGSLPQDKGTVDLPLLRLPGDTIKRQVEAGGQRAVTHFQVLSRSEAYTLISAALETGRTHQIRAHFAHLGFPLAGDGLYGGGETQIRRQALHCGEVSFYDPVKQQQIRLASPLPKDMEQLLAARESIG